MSSTAVALLIGALIALPQRHQANDAPPPVTVHLIELPPAPAQTPQAVSPEPPKPDAQAEPDVASMPEQPAETVIPVATELALVPAPLPTALVLPPLPAPATPHAPRPIPRPPRRPSVSPRTASTADFTAPPLAVAPPTPAQQPPMPASPPDTTSGIGPYRAGLHAQIERNMGAGTELGSARVATTTVIEAVIAPDGGVISARIAHGSGNSAFDRAALAAVQRGGYRRFGTHMPEQPITISVPITLAPD